MFNLKDNLLSSYNYDLPHDLIAQSPTEPRHAAKLMIIKNGSYDPLNITHAKIWDLKDELRPGDLLVVNNTRVLKARLRVRLSGGGLAELLLMEPRGEGCWLCLARPGRRMRSGDELWLGTSFKRSLLLKVIAKDESTGGRIIQFPQEFSSRVQMEKLLEDCGEVPLPPYINQDNSSSHDEKYQTRFALKPGAIAAPTAGLHLSDKLIEVLKNKGIRFAQITLHVGLGTFRPLEEEDLSHLHLHREWVEVNEDAIEAVENCKKKGGRVFAVGTTSVRALESSFILGGGTLKSFEDHVDLVIKPGFKFGVVDGLLTNFHLPKSSLLLLVSAFLSRKRMLSLYENAIENQYRFFSYGDAMLISPDSIL